MTEIYRCGRCGEFIEDVNLIDIVKITTETSVYFCKDCVIKEKQKSLNSSEVNN